MNWLKLSVLLLIIGFSISSSYAALYFYNTQQLEEEVKYLKADVQNLSNNVTVVVLVNFGNGTISAKVVHFILSVELSAFNVTQLAFGDEISYEYYPEYGDVVITRIFDVSNDINSSCFWSLYINGLPSAAGALKSLVFNDYIVEWRYQKF
ncbi:MAG: hypothetical protein QXJ17_05105 [Nitrososphaeria archaeon]